MDELGWLATLGGKWTEKMERRLGDPKLAILLEMLVVFFCRICSRLFSSHLQNHP